MEKLDEKCPDLLIKINSICNLVYGNMKLNEIVN